MRKIENPVFGETSKGLAKASSPRDTLSLVRLLLLAIIGIGVMGLIPELLLLGHVESPSQFIPLGLLAAIAVVLVMVYLKPTPQNLRIFQGVMILTALGGLLGLWEHLEGNLEYVREISPDLSGLPLIWRALHKGAPVLAPGVMVQMALLGLLFTFRHPGLNQAVGARQ